MINQKTKLFSTTTPAMQSCNNPGTYMDMQIKSGENGQAKDDQKLICQDLATNDDDEELIADWNFMLQREQR